jgi:hypothetical protein
MIFMPVTPVMSDTTGAKVPVAEYGLRDGVDNIGELSIFTSG